MPTPEINCVLHWNWGKHLLTAPCLSHAGKGGTAQVSGHVLRRLWDLKSSKMSQPGSWREYNSLKYCHGFWFILTAAHGLCPGFIRHLKLPEVPYAQNKNEWEGGLETDILWTPSNPHHCDSVTKIFPNHRGSSAGTCPQHADNHFRHCSSKLTCEFYLVLWLFLFPEAFIFWAKFLRTSSYS